MSMLEREKSVENPLILCMVGLPARGKTYIANKLERYLRWLGLSTRTFNIGSYRRTNFGAQKSAEFFNPNNPLGVLQRTECAVKALEDLFKWLRQGGKVAILDGTNSTNERRQMVKDIVQQKNLNDGVDYKLAWIESICDDEEILEANIRRTKLLSPDYVGISADDAVRDFRSRIAMYKKSYETLKDNRDTFIRIIDTGKQVVVNRIAGYVLRRIVFFLMNVRIDPCPIYLVRHAGSSFGGDVDLGNTGNRFAEKVADFLQHRFNFSSNYQVFCSTLKRATQTALFLGDNVIRWRSLTEIEVGGQDVYETEDDVVEGKDSFHATTSAFKGRYPLGESPDVIQRLEPLIFELESAPSPVVVVGDGAALRSIFAYFVDVASNETPHEAAFANRIFQLTPRAYGCDVERFDIIS